MIILGLTGGIASGKSTVAKQMRRLGAEIIDADDIAREIVKPGQTAWHKIIACFGNDILLADGAINRKKLGKLVFVDEKKRKQLEEITHPEIMAVIHERIARARRMGQRILVLDVPLLIEVGWRSLVEYVWLVYVDRDTQLQRLIKRDNLSWEEAQQRLAAQMPLEAKKKYANVIIDNSKTLEETEAQVQRAWEELQ